METQQPHCNFLEKRCQTVGFGPCDFGHITRIRHHTGLTRFSSVFFCLGYEIIFHACVVQSEILPCISRLGPLKYFFCFNFFFLVFSIPNTVTNTQNRTRLKAEKKDTTHTRDRQTDGRRQTPYSQRYVKFSSKTYHKVRLKECNDA